MRVLAVVVAIKSDALTALTLSALALPGISTASESGFAAESPQLNFQYAHYQESDDRISVNVFQGSAVFPVTEDFQFAANWVVDSWSGATPVLTLPESITETIAGASGIAGVDGNKYVTANAKPLQVMTGASPGETRYALDLSASYAGEDSTFHLAVSRSEEPDYVSYAYKIGMDWEINNKLTTLSLGFGQNFDNIKPTSRSISEHKTDYHLQLGFTQVLDKQSLLLLGVNFSYSSGYLSNPYKKVFIQDLPAGSGLDSGGFENVYFENRPDKRYLGSVVLGYIHYFPTWDSALHLDYRFYNDSWEISSHTFEAAWHQPLGDGWMLIPKVRYYSQSAAGFHQLFFTEPRADNYYSSDYRLDGFGTISGSLKLSTDLLISNSSIETAKFQVGFEYSRHAAGLKLDGKTGTEITDFDYFLATASINIQF